MSSSQRGQIRGLHSLCERNDLFEGGDVRGDNYPDYTRRWIEIVDKEGLLHIRDEILLIPI